LDCLENVGERVAIVGAGYAGMAAAVTLAQRGVAVTVFESGPVPGGRARRVVSQGTELDNGQHILIGAYAELFRLMRLVGVPADAVLRIPLEIRYAAGFYFRSLHLPFPFGLLGGLLLAKGIPFDDRLGAVRFMAAMRKADFRLDEDISVDILLRKHRQAGAIGRFLWFPLCISALNTPPLDASAQAFLVVLRDALCGSRDASDLVLPRVDLSRLFPEPAARFIEKNGGAVKCGVTVRELSALKEEFSKIIVAVGPHQLRMLLPGCAPDYSYQPIYTCYLQYPERIKLPIPMLGLADGLVQWVFDRGALTGEPGRLACVISAQGDHQQLGLDELADLCHRELAHVLRDLPPPLWSRVIAEKRATISCTPGVKGVELETNLPGVYLAGDYTDPEYPPTLEAAVRSGVRAASRI
jgi:squalene-associated FAD-dependent desaturase